MTQTTKTAASSTVPGGGVSMNGVPVATATEVHKPTPTAAPTPTTESIYDQTKLGSKCCGCCCDFRRAVIIVDAIGIVLAVLSLASLGVSNDGQYEAYGFDSQDKEAFEVYNDSLLVNAIVTGTGILALAAPIYGALKFQYPMVAFGIVWYVATFIVYIIVDIIYINKANDETGSNLGMPFLGWIVSAVVTALLIYPHAGLILEIDKGIMSQETYPREEYSCCCT